MDTRCRSPDCEMIVLPEISERGPDIEEISARRYVKRAATITAGEPSCHGEASAVSQTA